MSAEARTLDTRSDLRRRFAAYPFDKLVFDAIEMSKGDLAAGAALQQLPNTVGSGCPCFTMSQPHTVYSPPRPERFVDYFDNLGTSLEHTVRMNFVPAGAKGAAATVTGLQIQAAQILLLLERLHTAVLPEEMDEIEDSLIDVGTGAIPMIESFIASQPAPYALKSALRALGHLARARARETARKLLKHPNPRVRAIVKDVLEDLL